jgi:N-carbamoyl-L-amino-acid hydrolase
VLACDDVARRRSVTVRTEPINADPPASCATAVVAQIESAAIARGLRHRTMISRAYHDSLFMARVAPVGMIFIACRGGVSHRPDEYAAPDAIANGVAVLADTLAAVAGDP